MSAARVVVTIDEVRLHGFDPLDRSAIGDAIARELALRFTGEPVVPFERAVHRIDAGSFPVDRRASPGAIGAGIAAGIHRGVKTPC